MILEPYFNFLIALTVGFVAEIPAFISVIIIHSKYKSMLTDNMKDDHLQEYSDSIYPLISFVYFMIAFIVYQMVEIIREMCQ